MTDIFDIALANIFQTPGIGSLATYTPVTGPAVPEIYVSYVQETQLQGGLDGGVIQIAPTIEYILSDLNGAIAKQGDTFTIGTDVYSVAAQVSNDGKTAMVKVE
ncbi:MAG: hypothetical protein WBN66_02330 [Smithella sp.]